MEKRHSGLLVLMTIQASGLFPERFQKCKKMVLYVEISEKPDIRFLNGQNPGFYTKTGDNSIGLFEHWSRPRFWPENWPAVSFEEVHVNVQNCLSLDWEYSLLWSENQPENCLKVRMPRVCKTSLCFLIL